MRAILLILFICNYSVLYAQHKNEPLLTQYKEVQKHLLDEGYLVLIDANLNQGVMDAKSNNIIIPVEYTEILYQKKEKVFFVCKGSHREGYDIVGGKWGMMDSSGKPLTPLKYTRLYTFATYDNGYQPVNVDGVDSHGMFIGGKNGLLHKSGKEVIECKYDYVNPYVLENVTNVNLGGKWVKNNEGNWIFSGGKWGFVDLEGNVVVPIEYDKVIPFKDGVSRVTKNGLISLVNNPLKKGNQIAVSKSRNIAKSAIAVSRYPAPNSDVDKAIPVSSFPNENLFAFIIANENYPDAPVPFALNDGRIFKEYCLKTLGIPDKNIRMFEDATYGNIIAAVEQVKQIADAYEGEAGAIIYYAGHGVPDEKRSSAYLLPIDGNPSDVASTGYSLEHFYSTLSEMKLKNITVFLDACFSGAKREDEMLLAGRGVAIKVKEEAPKGNMVVFSAATGDETAHQLEEKGHGLFTYFLLKKMQETKGQIALGELAEYVTKQVKRQSVVINNKKQTPTVIPSATMADKWRLRQLK